MTEAFRITWQVRAGLEDVSVWSALVVADTAGEACRLVWERVGREAGSEDMSGLSVEAIEAPFVHIQKGGLWGEPWSVEIGFGRPLDEDQLAVLARRLARFEMTQKLGGEVVRSLRLTVPAHAADEARSRATALVLDALAGGDDHVEVVAGSALPVWRWERYTLDST
jgi:hypothetical protein